MYVVAVIGGPGSGKSSFVNSLAVNYPPQPVPQPNSDPHPVVRFRKDRHISPEPTFLLVDTPGLSEDKAPDEETIKHIKKSMSRDGCWLDGVIYLQRDISSKAPREAAINVREICRQFDIRGLRRIILATTFWNTMSEDAGKVWEQSFMNEMVRLGPIKDNKDSYEYNKISFDTARLYPTAESGQELLNIFLGGTERAKSEAFVEAAAALAVKEAEAARTLPRDLDRFRALWKAHLLKNFLWDCGSEPAKTEAFLKTVTALAPEEPEAVRTPPPNFDEICDLWDAQLMIEGKEEDPDAEGWETASQGSSVGRKAETDAGSWDAMSQVSSVGWTAFEDAANSQPMEMRELDELGHRVGNEEGEDEYDEKLESEKPENEEPENEAERSCSLM
ncbi:hypothetical protein CPLU01_04834 [Colletotrichum plurivorum]|uniref:G domain-containing protein n=1 Tax=Colletotrichum plurivorum TaxID=2175906 RepID=A0A8H6KMZ2_9PEZI|nr:hypothetical protein CPLU01_04834 [Colletotrichum plurivorum]